MNTYLEYAIGKPVQPVAVSEGTSFLIPSDDDRAAEPPSGSIPTPPVEDEKYTSSLGYYPSIMKNISVKYVEKSASKWQSNSMPVREAEEMRDQLRQRIGINLHSVTYVRRIEAAEIEAKSNGQAIVVVYMRDYGTTDEVATVSGLPPIAIVEERDIASTGDWPIKKIDEETTPGFGYPRRRLDLDLDTDTNSPKSRSSRSIDI